MDLEKWLRRLGLGIGIIVVFILLGWAVAMLGIPFSGNFPSSVGDLLSWIIVGLGLSFVLPYLQNWIKA